MKNSKKIMSSLVTIIVGSLFGIPAFYMVEDNILIGKWVISLQVDLLGVYFKTSSFLIVLLIEMFIVGIPIFLIAIFIKKITGKTIVDLLKKERKY